MEKKTLLLIIPLSIIIVILIIGTLNALGMHIYLISESYCGCHSMLPNSTFLFFGIILIFSIIPISYYFISKKMEYKLDKQMATILKFTNKTNPKKKDVKDKQSILRLLSSNERIILNKLIENKNGILQSEISRMENMNKLKTHRSIKILEAKGIIKRESYGKTHRILLTEDMKELFK